MPSVLLKPQPRSLSAVLSAGNFKTVPGWLSCLSGLSTCALLVSEAAVVLALLLFSDSVGLATQRSMWAARCSEQQELATSSTGHAVQVPQKGATSPMTLTWQALVPCPGAVTGRPGCRSESSICRTRRWAQRCKARLLLT